MRSSWLEQLCGKAISHQFAEKPQLGSSALPPPSPLSVPSFNHSAVSAVMHSAPG